MYIVMENIQRQINVGIRRSWIEEREIAFFNNIVEASEFATILIKNRLKAIEMLMNASNEIFGRGELRDEIEEMKRMIYALEFNELTFSVQDVEDIVPYRIKKEIYWIREKNIAPISEWTEN